MRLPQRCTRHAPDTRRPLLANPTGVRAHCSELPANYNRFETRFAPLRLLLCGIPALRTLPMRTASVMLRWATLKHLARVRILHLALHGGQVDIIRYPHCIEPGGVGRREDPDTRSASPRPATKDTFRELFPVGGIALARLSCRPAFKERTGLLPKRDS